MKRPFLCLSLTALMVISVGNPFTDLGAAEVWNSQKKRNVTSEKRTLYNTPKNSRAGKGVTTLFNRQNYGNVNTGTNGLNQRMQSYREFNVTEQRHSKLWDLLSPEALASKQADVNQALKNEYERKKETSKTVIAAMKEYEAYRLKAKREHEIKVAQYEADRDKYEEEQRALRDQALSEAQSSVAKDSRKGQSSDVVSQSNETTQVLKGSTRLFNSSKK